MDTQLEKINIFYPFKNKKINKFISINEMGGGDKYKSHSQEITFSSILNKCKDG